MADPEYPKVTARFHVRLREGLFVHELTPREARLLVNRLLAAMNRARLTKK